MRKLFITIIAALLAFSLQSQEFIHQYEWKADFIRNYNELPNHWTQKSPYRLTRDREMLLPGKGLVYYRPNMENPMCERTFHYNSEGLLLYEEEIPLPAAAPDVYARNIIYNQTFLKEDEDVVDTITWYSDLDFTQPFHRQYYNYHYHDISPSDSFYMEKINQEWDLAGKKWNNIIKYYEGYLDTILWEIIRIRLFIEEKDRWIDYEGMIDSMVYDERHFVTERIRNVYNAETKEYEKFRTFVYSLNEDGSVNEKIVYNYFDGAWLLCAKESDITWAEWHGYGGFCPIIYIGGEPKPLGKKYNKQLTGTMYYYLSDETWTVPVLYKTHWDDYGSHTDSVFRFVDTKFYLQNIEGNIYDQYGNYAEYKFVAWGPPDENGNQKIETAYSNKVKFFYNEYGCYKEEDWTVNWDTALNAWDSVMTYKFEVTEWIDPTQIVEQDPNGKSLLSIFPNPVSGILTISAPSAMQQLSIYDITGRLVASPSPAGERVVFDTGALPQGVYLVRALLKDGGVRTGKVVVR